MARLQSSTDVTPTPEAYWHSLGYFNGYRLVVSLVFTFYAFVVQEASLKGGFDVSLFRGLCLLYLLLNLGTMGLVRLRRPRFQVQLSSQVLVDVVCLVVLMHALGGIRSGLGLMLVITIAAASLISFGRLALFHAALATIGLLLQQTVASLTVGEASVDFLQAGLLSFGYFATAWLAHTLSRYAKVSERLAIQRGIDLANLARINQLVIRDMQDGVLVVDERDAIVSHNVQAENLLGSPGSDDDINLAGYCPELAERLRAWRDDSAAQFAPMHSPVTNRQLQTRFLAAGDKNPGATVVFLEDISRVQEQARQIKLAALGRLTASIAHEIRNPLSSISHAAELLEEERNLDSTAIRLLKIIRDNSLRLDRMVQEVLHLNRGEQAHPEPIEPRPWLKRFSLEFCQTEKVPETVFSLEVDTDRKLLFDRAHLHQVLWNLTRNAWRHCQQKDRSIRICLSRAPMDHILQLDVIDDGPGVEPALQGQLFEPFFTTEAQGTGLGLYIARQVCEANGALLDYVEVAPGGQFRLLIKEAP